MSNKIVIAKANIVVAMKGNRGRPVGINGLVLGFTDTSNAKIGDVFGLKYRDKNHYVEIRELGAVDKNELEFLATEVGYWASNIKAIEGLDVRDLIGLELTHTTNEEKLAQLRKSSCYT